MTCIGRNATEVFEIYMVASYSDSCLTLIKSFNIRLQCNAGFPATMRTFTAHACALMHVSQAQSIACKPPKTNTALKQRPHQKLKLKKLHIICGLIHNVTECLINVQPETDPCQLTIWLCGRRRKCRSCEGHDGRTQGIASWVITKRTSILCWCQSISPKCASVLFHTTELTLSVVCNSSSSILKSRN